MTLKLTGALAALALATTAHATDLRFGTDAAYPPYDTSCPTAASRASTSTSATRSAPPRR